MSIFDSGYTLAHIKARYNTNAQEYLLVKNQLSVYLQQYSFMVQTEKKRKYVVVKEDQIGYHQVKNVLYQVDEDQGVLHFVKNEEVKFNQYLGANMSGAFRLQRFFGLSKDIISKTMNGEQTVIICVNEEMDNTSEDVIEFNRIILNKRLAFALNYIAHLVLFEVKDSNLCEKMEYYVKDGIIVSKRFFDVKQQRFKHEKISVYFDGKVRTGSWYVDDLVVKYSKTGSILYIAEDSVYPLSLCLKNDVNFRILNREEKQVTDMFDLPWEGKFVCICLKDAIPGSGKTYSMIKQVEEKKEQCLIIVPTRAEVEELRKQGMIAYTIDSIHKKMNYCGKGDNFRSIIKSIKEVYFDECFMMHSGQIRYILKRIRSIVFYNYVYMYGDRGQIPFYSFTNVEVSHTRRIFDEVSWVEQMNVTYRCPEPIVPFIDRLYDRKVETRNNTNERLESIVIRSSRIAESLSMLIVKDFQILTFTQAEKIDIINRYKISRIMTIAESQGMTFKNVAVVRINQYERTIYSQKEHLTVALTRYTNQFNYTTVKEDYFHKMISAINKKQIKEFNFGENQMKLGKYMIENGLERKQGENIFEELKQVNDYYQPKRNVNYLNETRTASNRQDREQIIFNMKRTMTLFRQEKEKIELDNLEYVDKVIEYRDELVNSGTMKVNENKFIDILNHENLQLIEEQKRVSELKVGQFVVTEMPQARVEKQNLLTTFASIKKRNADVSKIRNFMMIQSPEEMVDNFFNVFVDQEKWDNSVAYREEFKRDFITEWKHTRDAQQLNKLAFEHENLDNIDFTEYHSFIKTIIKNQLNEESYPVEKVAQVVAGAHAVMVEYFTPMVKQFTLLLKLVLKDNVLINDGITVEQMEYFVNTRIRDGIEVVPLEMDYSKFDKNQDWIDLYYQMLIMRKFGIPDWICSEWISVHLITQLKFAKYGITVPTLFQRKSGDAFTFMGNTLFTMLMYSTFYNCIDFECALFGGDDSLVFFESNNYDMIMDKGNEIAAAFNMEIKYLDTTKSVMFASRFFVVSEGHIYILPDLVKQIIRYNRVVKSQEHALAQQMSSNILNKNIYNLDYGTLSLYIDQMFNRYDFNEYIRGLWSSLIFDFLTLLKSNKTYLLYHNFDQLPHADEGTMRQLRKHLLKKVDFKHIKEYRAEDWREIKFLKQIKRSLIKVYDEKEVVIEKNVVVGKYSTMKEVRTLYRSMLMSWFDRNGIARGNIFYDANQKYNSIELKEEPIKHQISLLDKIKSIMFSSVINMKLVFEESIFFENEVNDLRMQIQDINDRVFVNTGKKFDVHFVLLKQEDSE